MANPARPKLSKKKSTRALGRPGRSAAFLAVALFVIFSAYNLHRSIRSLPAVCPPFGSHPSRILSLSLGIDEILLDLVRPERIVALTYLSVNPEFSNVAERARAVPRHMASSVEKIVRLRPDLILATSFNNPEKVESLKALGCKVITVSRFDSIEGIRRSVRVVATAVGETKRGDALLQRMDRTLREAARLRREGDNRPRVLFAGPGGYTQGRATTINDLIRRAGGVNVAAERLVGIGRLSPEEWLVLKPDVVLRMSYASLDPFLMEVFRAAGRRSGPGKPREPVEVVMPSRLLTAVSPSSALAVRMLAEKLREAVP